MARIKKARAIERLQKLGRRSFGTEAGRRSFGTEAGRRSFGTEAGRLPLSEIQQMDRGRL